MLIRTLQISGNECKMLVSSLTFVASPMRDATVNLYLTVQFIELQLPSMHGNLPPIFVQQMPEISPSVGLC